MSAARRPLRSWRADRRHRSLVRPAPGNALPGGLQVSTRTRTATMVRQESSHARLSLPASGPTASPGTRRVSTRTRTATMVRQESSHARLSLPASGPTASPGTESSNNLRTAHHTRKPKHDRRGQADGPVPIFDCRTNLQTTFGPPTTPGSRSMTGEAKPMDPCRFSIVARWELFGWGSLSSDFQRRGPRRVGGLPASPPAHEHGGSFSGGAACRAIFKDGVPAASGVCQHLPQHTERRPGGWHKAGNGWSRRAGCWVWVAWAGNGGATERRPGGWHKAGNGWSRRAGCWVWVAWAGNGGATHMSSSRPSSSVNNPAPPHGPGVRRTDR